MWKKGQLSTTKPITKKNQCSDASDNLGIENRQHVGPHPSVCGSTLPSQVRRGSTATHVPIIEDARHTLGVLSGNMQQPRIHSSFPGSCQVRTGCTASNVPIASLPPAGGQPIQTLEEDVYLHSTISRRFGSQNRPHSYLGNLMDQTALFPSTQETRNTHTLDMPYFAANSCSFQQQPMEAPNHTRLSNNFV